MSPPRKARRTRFGVLAPCCALLIASCWVTSGTAVTTALPDASPGATNATGSASRRPALKPIDPAAFQSAVAGAARKLFVPGAVVLLRTPQGTFEGGKHITIADLLKMRSGLHDCTSAREPAATLDADPAKAWTPHEVLAMAFRHPPEFPPDASFEYCNTNYALLGLVAEKAGGRPLAQQFQDRLFGPLGLRRTSLPAADDNSLPDRFSHGYIARTTTSRSSSGRT
ncbi:serine hydrolase domain-containing protein [Streptomyces mirabilis]|uniref:serine hydrolase domain-containing protein n=1 Tax=Streptomyces mirabilis TaxID=68239 RepID=UPI0036C327B7